MPEFNTPVDIANRALQHCGAEFIDSFKGFTEVSKQARHAAFDYGKLRRAELQRNCWTFATRRTALRPIDTTTMLLQPSLWASTTTYYRGSIVNDGSGTLWISRIQKNLNSQPQNSTAWEPYFGPLTVSLYATGGSYRSGELVYTTAGDGTYRVYLSLLDGNSDNPATATTWSATPTYKTGDTITYLSVTYQSLIDLNVNQTPSNSPAAWLIGTTYSAAQKVYNPDDGLIYQSIAGGNIGHNPTSDGGVHWTNTGVLCPWTVSFIGGTGDTDWLEIGGAEFPLGVALTTIGILYPYGAGPSSQETTKNAYRLPAGYLRHAPQDPKAGAISYLGAPGNIMANDWEFEGDFLITRNTDVIILRFVADLQDVTRMNDMFCEGLAARIGLALCEPLTNSTAKLSSINGIYTRTINEARAINAIEEGADEAPLDDYLACRL